MNDSIIRLLFVSHLGATLFMVGLIWFVQVVHYPLFDGVGFQDFVQYEKRHGFWTTWVVGPPMLIEITTACLLLWLCPKGIPLWTLWTGLILVGIIWFSTAFVQVPCHEALTRGFDPVIYERLVSTNWIRTIAWSLRGILVLRMTWLAIS
jgi:hypothetical protein